MSILTQIRGATRHAAVGYLEAAQPHKRTDCLLIPWYRCALPYLAIILRNVLVAAVVTFSLVLSLTADAITEEYQKVKELFPFSAVTVTIKLATHIAVYKLAGEPSKFREYGPASAVDTGCVSAGFK